MYFKREYHDPKETIRRILCLDLAKNRRVIFSWLLDGPSNHPNAMSIAGRLIVVNAEWAARLTLFDDNQVWEAFWMTIGHELTHLSGEYVFWEIFTKDKRFVNWVSEVHADYGGAVYAFDGNIEKAINALKYKARDYRQDKDHQGHPSWQRREEYLTEKRFDRELILKIANDTGCVNQTLINSVCKFYKTIVLET